MAHTAHVREIMGSLLDYEWQQLQLPASPAPQPEAEQEADSRHRDPGGSRWSVARHVQKMKQLLFEDISVGDTTHAGVVLRALLNDAEVRPLLSTSPDLDITLVDGARERIQTLKGDQSRMAQKEINAIVTALTANISRTDRLGADVAARIGLNVNRVSAIIRSHSTNEGDEDKGAAQRSDAVTTNRLPIATGVSTASSDLSGTVTPRRKRKKDSAAEQKAASKPASKATSTSKGRAVSMPASKPASQPAKASTPVSPSSSSPSAESEPGQEAPGSTKHQ